MNTASDTLLIINAAILAGEAIQFDYTDKNGDSTKDRILDVSSLITTKEDGTKIAGQCRLRSGYREFVLSRMSNVKKYVKPFVTVKLGDKVQINTGYSDSATYIVARFDHKKVGLISLTNGNRWGSPITVEKEFEPFDIELFDENMTKVDVEITKVVPNQPRYFRANHCHNYDRIVYPNGQITYLEPGGLECNAVGTVDDLINGPYKYRWTEVKSRSELH